MKRNADQIFNKYCKLLYKISIILNYSLQRRERG